MPRSGLCHNENPNPRRTIKLGISNIEHFLGVGLIRFRGIGVTMPYTLTWSRGAQVTPSGSSMFVFSARARSETVIRRASQNVAELQYRI
jgi:hypothetical protein